MSELIRKIEEKDIPQIRNILMIVFNDDKYKDIERLGGMTNHSYKITRFDGKEFLVRIPGEGTEEMINRLDEKKSTELACKLGIDSELLYFGDDGCKVMLFFEEPQEMNEKVMQKKENLTQAANIFYKLHNCGVDTKVPFEVFDMAKLYEKVIINSNTKVYDDYNDVKNTVMNIKNNIDRIDPSKIVPCHNDSLMGNWVLDKNNILHLIDWEYSGMNDYMWDLSCFSIEADYSDEQDRELLLEYFKREITSNEKKHFIAAKIYVDYLWTLWGLTRVQYDGAFMQEYADLRYKRLKINIEKFKSVND